MLTTYSMGRKISDYSGTVIAPGAPYSFGRVKNAPTGTIVDEAMMGDITQFFQKAANASGTTYNDLPDNDTNGYQYYDAVMSPKFDSTGIVFTNSGNNVWADTGAGYYNVAYSIRGNIITLCGAATNGAGGTPATTSVLTLPVSARPVGNISVVAMTGTGATVRLDISTAGAITSITGLGTGETVFFDNISFRLV